MFLHNLLNVLVQIANKMGLQKEKNSVFERAKTVHALDMLAPVIGTDTYGLIQL
jgi:hypothetical protein